MRMSYVVVVLLSLAATATSAQRFVWPEEPENLTELEGFTGEQLRPVMTGFARALGVRCSHCHVGEEGAPLSTYDFASDDNPMKNTAREMLRLLGSVNDHLAKIEPSGTKRVNMWCHTCHNGRPRPTSLTEELEEAYTDGGVDAVIAHHAELLEQHRESGGMSFDEVALNVLGYRVLGEDDTAGAIRLFRLNAETYPESGNVWDSLAEAYMKAGERELAIVNYQRSLVLESRNTNARDMLRRLGAFGEAPKEDD